MSENHTDQGRFSGRTAIVTGASRGFGLAVAERLVAEGARVGITARQDGPLDEAATALPRGRVITVAGQADDPEHRREVLDTIRVNAVAPAVVKTRVAEALYEGKEAKSAARYPLQRLGVPSGIASTVAYLASADSSWVTGHVLTVDGGLTIAGGTT
ncbi:SDR family oxidoreductase [Streptomyces sp. NPDC015139]|uniref:SDR family oxidoreductase n=1 Tax=Streptomyces sp. NPDC015139 TaxID=3364942 RepID=UPI0036F4BA39